MSHVNKVRDRIAEAGETIGVVLAAPFVAVLVAFSFVTYHIHNLFTRAPETEHPREWRDEQEH